MKPTSWSLIALLCCGPLAAQEKKTADLINPETTKAIGESLAWLAKQQHADGSFGTSSYRGNTAVTGLAGLAFLSRGREPINKEYDKTLEKVVEYILAQADGKKPGYLAGAKALNENMYGHGFALLFLAEAFPNLSDKKQKARTKEVMERAVRLLVDIQNRDGGWRYAPIKADADVSVTAVQAVALRAARDAGVTVPEGTIHLAAAYLKKCQDKATGGFRYQPYSNAPGFARTAAAITALDCLGVKDAEVKKGMDYLRKADWKVGHPGSHYSYGNYYAAKAMWNAGDQDWQLWYPKFRDDLLSKRTGDHWAKSDLNCPHYCTAMALIILQMPHAQLPSLKR